MNEDLQKLRQLGYDSIADEIADAIDRCENRFKAARTSVPEGYVQGYFGIKANLTVRINRNHSISEEYSIYLQLAGASNAEGKILDVASVFSNSQTNIVSHWRNRDRYTESESAVFVDPVQFVQLPQGMLSVVIPSVIRLERLDSNPRCGGDASDLFLFALSIHGRSVKDGKFGTTDLPVEHMGSVRPSECECQMVERSSGVEENVPNEQFKTFGHVIYGGDAKASQNSRIADNSNGLAERLRRGLRVWFINDAVGIGLKPNSELLIERMEVFARPL